MKNFFFLSQFIIELNKQKRESLDEKEEWKKQRDLNQMIVLESLSSFSISLTHTHTHTNLYLSFYTFGFLLESQVSIN